MNPIQTPTLSLTQRLALHVIDDGADIYDRELAGALREIERMHPELIAVGQAMMYAGDGTDRMPYFGAIVTAAGRRATGFGGDGFRQWMAALYRLQAEKGWEIDIIGPDIESYREWYDQGMDLDEAWDELVYAAGASQ